jgi:hypothetical protein
VGPETPAYPAGQLVDHHGADIVPVSGVAGPGIAQPHYKGDLTGDLVGAAVSGHGVIGC